MKVSLKWLKDYVDISLAPKELAEKLTMAGMEVRSIQTIGGTWENLVVGEVVTLNPHPNADRLKLPTVNLGTKQVTVVCGAPNISLGQKVVFASVGTQLIDGHTGKAMTLKPAKIRGVVSEGMVCSEKELGISDSHEGIMVLPSEAPTGMPLGEYIGDTIFDLDITPNRPDCLSVIGIAREIAALTDHGLHLLEIHYEETEDSIDPLVSVAIVEPNLCPRYCASLVTGIKVGPSPWWLQQRLRNYGMRPISNIVDVTNYVMLEYGQPLHAFDYQKLRGHKIIVRRAESGETITTLDGVERILTQDTLVIADEEKPVAIAGIMGGLDTEVTDATDIILLEAANFNQAVIRRGCRHLGLQSEASIRFDKGLSPGLPQLLLKRATQLVLELACGKAAKGVIDAYPGRGEPRAILLSTEEVKRLSGLEVDVGKITKVLQSLGFECQESHSPSQISVVAPYWRSDVKYAADLVEEVVRITGYEKVPTTRLSSSLPMQEPIPMLEFKRRLHSILVSCGLQEILSYSLTSLEKLQKLSPDLDLKVIPLKVANPLTKEQEYLRTTLRTNVLATLASNQKHEENGIKLFEIGEVFLPQGKELPQEKDMLCAVLSGPRQELSWHGDNEPLDFFDAKGVVESLFNQLGLVVTFEVSDDESLFPGRAVDIIISGDKVGIIGELHPKVTQAFELSGTVYLIEMDMEKLLDKTTRLKEYRAIPRFPGLSRDISLVIDKQVTYQQVEGIIQSFPLASKATLFDLYIGKQLPEGKKSFAVRIAYQSPERTLTDEEINKTQEQMLDRLRQELGATLRS
ncbi:MAG: phenylalanine--tRNA ligase subunit beta [Dehalococcoidia bacterium]|nr:phenylalanine--tRNA ligase subunit beta [Dehalococcoidia bacterium]